MRRVYQHHTNEKGVALITMMLMSLLVVGLVLMAITNGMVGKTLTSSHLRDRRNVQCAEGNLNMGEAVFLSVFRDGAQSLATAPGAATLAGEAGLFVDASMQAGDTTFSDLDEEMRGLVDTTEGLPNANRPDMTIRDPNNPNCATAVDVDFVYSKQGGGSVAGAAVAESANEYHVLIGGAACDNGTLYNINTNTTSNITAAQSTIRSVYNKCPGA